MADPKTNIAASVRDRLKNEARKQGTTLNALLIRFGLERFLYRLGQSPHRDRYLLKGAMLFVSWAEMPFRQTQDLDLSAPAPFDPDRVEADIRDICSMAIKPDDGLFFEAESLRVEVIREANSYHGFRARFAWALGTARSAACGRGPRSSSCAWCNQIKIQPHTEGCREARPMIETPNILGVDHRWGASLAY